MGVLSSEITRLNIGLVDRKDDSLRVDVWRTLNAAGRARAVLRNPDGKFNQVFDIQDFLNISLDAPWTGAAANIFWGRVDGPGVKNRRVDGEAIWDPYSFVSGVDQWQDLLFHNDFEKFYPDNTQTIDDILQALFITPDIDTNITWVPKALSPVVNAIEFKEGTSFLTTFQEMLRKAGWVAFVNDFLQLNAGDPGFSATGEIFTSIRDDPLNNILGITDLVERDGDKLYNYVKLYGKNPMFDAWSEINSPTWEILTPGAAITDDLIDFARFLGNTASIRAELAGGAVLGGVNLQPFLDFRAGGQARTDFFYESLDLSKGEIGFWAKYRGALALNQVPIRISLTDINNSTINFYSGTRGIVTSGVNSTRVYKGFWGWCTAPIGKDVEFVATNVPDQWWPIPVGDFDWSQVQVVRFQYEAVGADRPDSLSIDGLTLPVPAIAISEVAGGAINSKYRRRPLVLNMPEIRLQNSLQSKADGLIALHKDSDIDSLSFTTMGNPNIHYAGESITVNIPGLSINNGIFSLTSIHHLCEPGVDVSDGFGWDWITEIECVPIARMYDFSRLGDRGVYSGTQVGSRSGAGVRVK